MQAMYDLVGDKIREIFDAQVVDIGIYDKDAGLVHFPYTIERGVRFPDEPMPLIGFRRHVMDSGQPLLIDRDAMARQRHSGSPVSCPASRPSRSSSRRSSSAARRTASSRSRTSTGRTPSAESDVELLSTLAASLSVALENARLHRRDAPAGG